ncbi:TetR/AcrR family transcriptional regulator [Aliidiomarina sanyensis]|uniref:TetR family transcriptional regulator n=1 Tax=Aliidiomarina sanyensis TaxID=1249555 RepID=A0A432WEP4_9GAMM|nr:TetR/AcrR family transcriptional regulator [Aliidiomarina sanyensis]RUO31351.1 TetR family transcriptional regulator [Aliidiomarina sanyensis]
MAKALRTKDKIIVTAEMLFAEHGFEQTSLRQITSEADVNLASVNYHFGSKKALIQAVMARYQSVFMPALDAQLTELARRAEINGATYNTVDVLACVNAPLLALKQVRLDGPVIYLRLLGYAYSEIQGHLRKFTMTHYGNTVQQFFAMIQTANPSLCANTLFWRLHFSLGAMLFAQVSGQALREIAASDFGEEAHAEETLAKLLPFVAAGIAAPDPRP